MSHFGSINLIHLNQRASIFEMYHKDRFDKLEIGNWEGKDVGGGGGAFLARLPEKRVG